MCVVKTGGFFELISKEYGESTKRLLRNWVRNKFKTYITQEQRKFLIKCRSTDVMPSHIYNMRFPATIQNNRVNRKYMKLRKSYQKRLLNMEIKDIHSQISKLKQIAWRIEEDLRYKIPVYKLNNFFESNKNKFNNCKFKTKVKLINKYNRLKYQQLDSYKKFFEFDNSKWIINNCSIEIPENISRILSLGERFGLPVNANDKKDCKDITLSVIKNFETSTYKFPEKSLEKTRAMFVNSLNKHLYSSKHLNYIDAYILREVNKCKKFLKNNDEVFVTRADKGQITVTMDKEKYIEQMNNNLNDANTYRKINKNPLRKITTRLNDLVQTWRKKDWIDDNTYRDLKCTNGNLPRCYGLPKVHKPGFPLRIVVSSVGSPLYNIAKFLHEVLNTSIKKPSSHVKDSWSFANYIRNKTIAAHEILLSLDVTALFNNIPKELVMRAIESRWGDIQKSVKFDLTQFVHALDLILSSTCFSFNDTYYEQIYGSPMGSPLSPILADMVMDDLETHCIKKLNFEIHTYYRYVDDIFLIIPKTKVESVLKTFNNYHPRLKFTHEMERNNTLSFLNTSVIREGERLLTNWYRKPTYSGRYINYFSSHPKQYKLNTITNLVDQAIMLSSERFQAENINIIKGILINNCYPVELVNKKIKERIRAIKINKVTTNEKTDYNIKNTKKVLTLPFVKNASDDIRGIVKNCVDVVYTIPKKLNMFIKNGKDRLTPQQKTEIVYKINCKDCDQAYIGQTKRHLETRIKEHRNNIKNPQGNYSVITEHRLSCYHDFEWEKPEILHMEKNRRKREIAEMFFIKKFKKSNKSINLQKDTDNLNVIYDRIIT